MFCELFFGLILVCLSSVKIVYTLSYSLDPLLGSYYMENYASFVLGLVYVYAISYEKEQSFQKQISELYMDCIMPNCMEEVETWA